jgi:hypothetical protein
MRLTSCQDFFFRRHAPNRLSLTPIHTYNTYADSAFHDMHIRMYTAPALLAAHIDCSYG